MEGGGNWGNITWKEQKEKSKKGNTWEEVQEEALVGGIISMSDRGQ